MAGKLIFSMDFECGWGVIGNDRWRQREKEGVYRDMRDVLPRALRLLDDLGIAIDWFVVGGMITAPEKCSVEHLNGKFGAKARQFLAEASEETRDGRDLLEMVMKSKMKHRFGTHSFSHVLFSDPEQSRESLLEDLRLARRANDAVGIASDRLVFPENHFGHFDVVKASGISTVRMPAFEFSPRPAGMLGVVRQALSGVPQATTRTDTSSGLDLCHGSLLFNWGADSSLLRAMVLRRRLWAGLDAAAKGGTVHYWLHPFNLVHTKGLFAFFADFMSVASRLREQKKLEFIGFPEGYR